ncbi:zinc finger protein 385B-like [Panicum virgatum]|uniref:zinc finger protein 385B-like n=1 Tax=Panicum virgatum TaxID=38727 RepID=UPI0019D679F4|nr:zinc finger protein 385B-like [Panicum virgatum]
MESSRRGSATAAADGDVSDGRPSRYLLSHGRTSLCVTGAGYSTLVIRDALQAQLQKDRLRQEIIEAELAKIDRALNCMADVQQGKPVPFVLHRGDLGAVQDPKDKDERSCSLDLKPWKPVTESKQQESNEKLTEITLPVKQPKSSERWSCTVCQVEATSEHNLQQHFAGQQHRSNVASLESRNNGGRHQTTIRALQQEESKSMAMSYGHLGAPSAWGKLPLNGSSSNSVGSSEMARHMISLYFCKVCNVQCSDEFKFEEHRRGKKHRGKVWKQKVMTFCNVCKVQCNSEQMLANHLTGKKHQKNASLMGLI